MKRQNICWVNIKGNNRQTVEKQTKICKRKRKKEEYDERKHTGKKKTIIERKKNGKEINKKGWERKHTRGKRINN